MIFNNNLLHNLMEVGLDINPTTSWLVVKVLPGGRNEVVASGLTFEQAQNLSEQYLVNCLPGEKISLQEEWQSLSNER